MSSANRAPTGVKVIATLLAVVSVLLLLSEMTDDGLTDSWRTAFSATPVLAGLKLAAAVAGFVAAHALWSAKRSGLWLYLVWVALVLGIGIRNELRVEPVLWKRVVDIAAVSAVPLLGAVYLVRRLKA